MAMEALRSLWLSSCALAVEPRAEARTQPNVSAPERSEDRNILLLPNCRHGDWRKYSRTLAIKGGKGVRWRRLAPDYPDILGRGSRQICCDAQQASPPDVIASVRPESQQEGKPHEAPRVHHAAHRRCGGVAAARKRSASESRPAGLSRSTDANGPGGGQPAPPICARAARPRLRREAAFHDGRPQRRRSPRSSPRPCERARAAAGRHVRGRRRGAYSRCHAGERQNPDRDDARRRPGRQWLRQLSRASRRQLDRDERARSRSRRQAARAPQGTRSARGGRGGAVELEQPIEGRRVEGLQDAARTVGLSLRSFEARSPEELDGALAAIRSDLPDALITFADGFTIAFRRRIGSFALAHRLPMISELREFAEVGGLATYGAHRAGLWGRSASCVAEIARGASPRGLPVDQPTTFELVRNLTPARALGLTVPETFLARADEVIE